MSSTMHPSDLRRLLNALLLGLFVVVVLRTAWLCDDAYITFRTVDNLVSGYGPRWNVGERVQAFTHPLWLLLLAVPYSVSRDAYFTSLVLSILLSVAAVWIVVARIARSATAAVVGGVTLIFSKAFVDYSTSGLENPLTHLLLAAFLAIYWRAGDDVRWSVPLWTFAGLLMLNRLDTGLLVIPALLAAVVRVGWRRTWRAAAIGLAPLATWELFSIVYYGFPFPNTAYAKLQTGARAGTLAAQGLLYLLDSVAQDPVTLLATSGFFVAVAGARFREAAPFIAGILLYLVFIVRIGGDFMSGRFLAAPLLCAVALFVHAGWRIPRALAAAIVLLFAFLGVLATTRPPITSGTNTFIMTPDQGLGVGGVADERAFYYRYTGLLRTSRELPLPHNAEVVWGREARATPGGVVVHANVGLFGYFAGPTVHIVDPMALTDPLLARLPAEPNWRIGHFERKVPNGYVTTLQTGNNVIADPAVGMLYERLRVITRGPVWSRRRWRAILLMNLGW